MIERVILSSTKLAVTGSLRITYLDATSHKRSSRVRCRKDVKQIRRGAAQIDILNDSPCEVLQRFTNATQAQLFVRPPQPGKLRKIQLQFENSLVQGAAFEGFCYPRRYEKDREKEKETQRDKR